MRRLDRCIGLGVMVSRTQGSGPRQSLWVVEMPVKAEVPLLRNIRGSCACVVTQLWGSLICLLKHLACQDVSHALCPFWDERGPGGLWLSPMGSLDTGGMVKRAGGFGTGRSGAMRQVGVGCRPQPLSFPCLCFYPEPWMSWAERAKAGSRR